MDEGEVRRNLSVAAAEMTFSALESK
jgi:hypothetical protein